MPLSCGPGVPTGWGAGMFQDSVDSKKQIPLQLSVNFSLYRFVDKLNLRMPKYFVAGQFMPKTFYMRNEPILL